MSDYIMANPRCVCGHGFVEHRESVLGRAECDDGEMCGCRNFSPVKPQVCICGIPLAQHGNGCLRTIPTTRIAVSEIDGWTGLPNPPNPEILRRCSCGHPVQDHTERVHSDGVTVACHCGCDLFEALQKEADATTETLSAAIIDPFKAFAEKMGKAFDQIQVARKHIAMNDDIRLEATAHEAVDHPEHYGGADDPYEHIKVCEAKGWGYHIGNCTKYLWRVGKKGEGKELEDLKKARWYLDRYIQKIEEQQTP